MGSKQYCTGPGVPHHDGSVSLTLVFSLSLESHQETSIPVTESSLTLLKGSASKGHRQLYFHLLTQLIGAFVTFLLLCRDTASYVFLLFSKLQFLIAPDDWTYDVKGCCEVLGEICVAEWTFCSACSPFFSLSAL